MNSFTSKFSQTKSVGLPIAGALGGGIGFASAKLLSFGDPSSSSELRISQGVWFGFVIAGIGLAIALAGLRVDGRQASQQMLIQGLAVLGVAGFVGGVVAQMIFDSILNTDKLSECFSNYQQTLDDSGLNWCYANVSRLPRTVGWAIAGSLGGLGIGATFRSKVRAQKAATGALIASILGGVIFDTIPAVTGAPQLWPSQLIAVVLIGVLTAVAINLVENLNTRYWVEFMNGELRGRRIQLIERVSSIGSDRTSHIPIIGDREASEFHARIVTSGSGAAIEQTGGTITVNGKPGATSLRSGDMIEISMTQLRFGAADEVEDPLMQRPIENRQTAPPAERPKPPTSNPNKPERPKIKLN